jgi:hypothetical protein
VLAGVFYRLGQARQAIGLSEVPFEDPATVWTLLAGFGGFLLLNAWLDSRRGRASLGKRCCGLQVSDAAGQRRSFGAALRRLLMRCVTLLPLGLGGIVAARGPAYLAWHDRITGTRVTAAGARPEDLAGPAAGRTMALRAWIVLLAVLASPLLAFVGMFLLVAVASQVDYHRTHSVVAMSDDVVEIRTPSGRRQWTRKDNGADVDRAAAIAYCANLALDGGRWQLPDWDDGIALNDDSGWNLVPCFDPLFQRDATCHVSPLFRLSSSQVWLRYELPDDADKGWYAELDRRYPSIAARSQSEGMRALCVRPVP